jgi:pantetheine-phosphate adenylyltransferase
MKTAIYPGSFDPITLGHLNIIRRASGIFERVVVCIMPNAGKLHPMFTREERVALARRVVSRFPNVEVDTFDGLLAEYAKTFPEGAVIVKGLRANTDFENEFQMALINHKINPELDTMFLTSEHQYMYLSSSTVKELAYYDVDLQDFLPAEIIPDFQKRIQSMKIQGGSTHA